MKKVQWPEKYIIRRRQGFAPEDLFPGKRGSMPMDVVLTGGLVIFILLPLFAVILEHALLLAVRREISDALDMSCLAVYESIDVPEASSGRVTLDAVNLEEVFRLYLQANLSLDENLAPLSAGSLLQGGLIIRELDVLYGEDGETCSLGNPVRRLTVHAVVAGSYATGLFERAIFGGEGIRTVMVHRDVEIPDDRREAGL
ncbi:MAG TPA: hypothetical protein DD727_04355 [Clostridiales bacterium]|nr:hypothetical protein [Clostridiales bacterium]